MTFELPDGWKLVTVSELAGLGGLVADGDWIESKDQDPDGDVRLIQLADIGVGEFLNRSERFLTNDKARELQCTMLDTGDLLVARMPDPLGRACLFPGVGQPSVTAVDVFIWRPGKNAANARWLMHAINSPQVREHLENIAGGTTRQRVSGGNLKRLMLPTPPKVIQDRMVAKLDGLLDRSKNALRELDYIPKLVDRYKQAVLSAAFRGDLTVQWREENSSTAWQKVTVKEIAGAIFDGPFGSHLKTDDYSHSGALVVRLENIGPLQFRRSKRTYIPLDKYAGLSKHTLQAEDILLSSFVDESVRVCQFPNDLGDTPAVNKADCFCIRVKRTVCLPDFLTLRLFSTESYDYMRGQVHGATRPRINLGHLKKFSFDLPGLDEQQEIVRRVTGAFSSVDAVVTRREHVGRLLKRLNEAILAKAFHGELLTPIVNE
jgi:type I restriction enzyme S subunit